MCGILFVYRFLKQKMQQCEANDLVSMISKRQKHRGPDESGLYGVDVGEQFQVYLSHERLSIIDLKTGKQPLFNEDKSIVLVHNGEIYNHQKLFDEILKPKGHSLSSYSDSEKIIHMYEEFGAEECCKRLDGYFAFVLYDSKTDTVVAGRDPIGIKPLFIGRSEDGSVWFSSEVKALCAVPGMQSVEYFQPGHYYVHKNAHTTETTSSSVIYKPYYQPLWFDSKIYNKNESVDLHLFRQVFERAVEKRLMSDVPLGVFLSGGLDSSLVAAITRKLLAKRSVHVLHSFSVGVKSDSGMIVESPDILAARKVAKHIGTVHHEKLFTIEEGITAVHKVIQHIESYDVTTVRASTPMYLLSELASQYVKVVMSGEGADEVFAGYRYFRDASGPQHLQDELVRKVKGLHLADVLRCDRSTAAHGLEARVPFLDLEFLDMAMSIHPSNKLFRYKHDEDESRNHIEKYIIRKAFDKVGLLPDALLWRSKEQFSDGVGSSWIDSLIAHCTKHVSDEQMSKAAQRFPHNTPMTKEAYYYREIFEKHFSSKIGCDKLINKWLPWGTFDVDPSGRFQRKYAGVHEDKNHETWVVDDDNDHTIPAQENGHVDA